MPRTLLVQICLEKYTKEHRITEFVIGIVLKEKYPKYIKNPM